MEKEDINLAFQNISKVCHLSHGNFDYHDMLQKSLKLIREALKDLDILQQREHLRNQQIHKE